MCVCIRSWTCQIDGQNAHRYIRYFFVGYTYIGIITPTQKMSCRRAPEYNAKEYYRRRSRVWYVLTNYCVPAAATEWTCGRKCVELTRRVSLIIHTHSGQNIIYHKNKKILKKWCTAYLSIDGWYLFLKFIWKNIGVSLVIYVGKAFGINRESRYSVDFHRISSSYCPTIQYGKIFVLIVRLNYRILEQ